MRPSTQSSARRFAFAIALAGTTALAGCGDDTAPVTPGEFPPLHYGYLPPIRLNVASIDVGNAAPPSRLAAKSPALPADALAAMAHDRLQPAGPTGTALFTITDAGIDRNDDGGLTEHLAAHVDITGADGAREGFAEARVSRSVSGDEAVVGPASLYALTRQTMEDMNVEFEYQVRAHLADWLVTPGAAIEAPVSQAPLGLGGPVATPAAGAPLPIAPGGGPGGVPAPSGGPTELVPPSNGVPAPGSPYGGSAPSMSPPPGYLTPPAGSVPYGGPGAVPGSAGGGAVPPYGVAPPLPGGGTDAGGDVGSPAPVTAPPLSDEGDTGGLPPASVQGAAPPGGGY